MHWVSLCRVMVTTLLVPQHRVGCLNEAVQVYCYESAARGLQPAQVLVVMLGMLLLWRVRCGGYQAAPLCIYPCEG